MNIYVPEFGVNTWSLEINEYMYLNSAWMHDLTWSLVRGRKGITCTGILYSKKKISYHKNNTKDFLDQDSGHGKLNNKHNIYYFSPFLPALN